MNMWLDEPDNCGTIFNLDDRWSEWVHWFATLPVGNDIKSPPPPFHLKPTVTWQQRAEPTRFCWEHARTPCQQPSPSTGFPDNSCSLPTVITTRPSPLTRGGAAKPQKCSRLNDPLTVRKCCWSASWWRHAAPGTFHISDAGWSSGSPSLSGPRCQTAQVAGTKEVTNKGRVNGVYIEKNGFFPSQHLDFHLLINEVWLSDINI